MDKDLLEYIVLDVIKECPDFAHVINQHEITDIVNANNRSSEYKINTRTVRRIIEDLIAEGEPIISSPSSPGGYCWQGADGESLECYKRLRRKGIKILIRARRILRNCNKEARLF